MSISTTKKLLITLIEKMESKIEAWRQSGYISNNDYKEMKDALDCFIRESGLQRFCVQCGKKIMISHHNQTYCSECSTNAERVKRSRNKKL